MLACSGRRDSGPAGGAASAPSLLSLSKTWVASSSSSQSMLSFAPPFGAVGGAGGTTPAGAADALVTIAAGPGRVLAGGGAWLWTFCVVLGACEGDALVAGGMFDGLGDPVCATRFGSDPRPGGGGGFDGDAAGALEAEATRIAPDCGGEDGSGGGAEMRPPDGGPAAGGDEGAAAMAGADAEGVVGGGGGAAGMPEPLGAWAGPGIPMSVFFMSTTGLAGAGAVAGVTARFGADADWGGGGGAAAVRGVLFLPRPSKMSRSEPLLLSSDIRVS